MSSSDTSLTALASAGSRAFRRWQPVVKVRRHTEGGDAPGRPPQRGCRAGDPGWQGVTTENRGPRRAWFARWASKLRDYLQHRISRAELVDWAEGAMMEA